MMSGLKRLPLLFKQPVRRASFMDKMSKDVRSKNPLKWTDYGDGLNASRPPKHADIVVIGGGVMGSSVAYFLRRQAQAGVSVCVVERDMSYTRASSALAVGGIRQQFSVPENIYMSLYSAHFLRNIKQYLCVDDRDPPDIQFNHQGYLTLASPDNAHILEENFKLQTELGAKLELLSSTGLKERFPWINNEGVEVGAYGLENEGWFDPYLLTRSFQQKAESLGAQYCRGEVIGFECNQVDKGMGVPGYYQGQGKRIKSVKVRMPNSPEVIDVNCAMAVVCAGSWSGEITSMLGIGQGSAEDLLDVPLPVEPRKRYVYVTHCPDGPGLDFPMIINLDGVYARREGLGGNYVMGSCPFPEQVGIGSDLTFALATFGYIMTYLTKCTGRSVLLRSSRWSASIHFCPGLGVEQPPGLIQSLGGFGLSTSGEDVPMPVDILYLMPICKLSSTGRASGVLELCK